MIYEKELDSSAISKIAYDTATRELKVVFTSGTTAYSYYDVPEAEVHELAAAESVGRYFATHIKKYAVKR